MTSKSEPKDFETVLKGMEEQLRESAPDASAAIDAYLTAADATQQVDAYLASFGPVDIVSMSAGTGTDRWE